MGLTLTYGAYVAEVYRTGIEAVPRGQIEAARSLGMSHGQAMRLVIVPQAVRKVDPAAAQRLHRADEGHLAGQRHRRCSRSSRSAATSRPSINGSALTLGALLFLVVTIPLARFVDWLIARQQARPARGGRRETRGGHRGRADERTGPRADRRTDDAATPGRTQALRRAARAARRRPRRRPRRRRLRDRAERVRQDRRCCAASTCSSRPRRAGSWSRARRSPARATRAPDDIDFVRRRVGIVFQQFNLFPHMTALENVSIAPGEGARPPHATRPRAKARDAARPGRARRQARRVPGPPLRRPAAAGRDRAGAGDGPAR